MFCLMAGCGILFPCRDFAFVANDKDTCMLKCHVFRCSAPAKTIATALHEMCSKVTTNPAYSHSFLCLCGESSLLANQKVSTNLKPFITLHSNNFFAQPFIVI